MILSVTLNPCIDQTLFVDGLKPHDTNRVMRTETDAGGKGINVSRVAAELGAESVATGFLGGGPGAFIKSVLDRQGVHHEFVEIVGDTRTNFSVEDGSGEPPTTFNAKGPAIEQDEWQELVTRISALAQKADWVVLGGSLPQGVPVDAYELLGEVVKVAGANLAIDADGEVMRRGLEAKPKLIKPNGREAGRLLGRKVEKVEEAIFAAEELRQYLDDDGICIVSLSHKGAVMACQEGTYVGSGIEIEPNSTIGSGDSLVGGFLQSVERGEELTVALKVGLAAGAATAMTNGAEIARREVVEELLPSAQVELAR